MAAQNRSEWRRRSEWRWSGPMHPLGCGLNQGQGKLKKRADEAVLL